MLKRFTFTVDNLVIYLMFTVDNLVNLITNCCGCYMQPKPTQPWLYAV